MKCNQFFPLLSGHLDGANSEIEERRLQQHLKTCRQCRELLAQMEENDALLASQENRPPVDLTARIMSQVRKEEKKPRFGRNFLISTAATGLAAAALLAFVIWGNVSLPKTSDSTMESVSFDLAAETAYNDASTPAENNIVNENTALSDTLTASSDLYNLTGPNNSHSTPADSGSQLNAPETEPAPTQVTQPTETKETVVVDSTEIVEPTEPKEEPKVTDPTQDTYFEPSPPPLESSPEESAPEETIEPPPMFAYQGDVANNQPPKRGISKQKAIEGPVLVIWKTDTAEIAGLSDCTLAPAEAASADALGDNLYTRMNNGLFLRPRPRDDGQEASLAVNICTVDYETLTALFDECAGTYELCVYYPASIKTLEKCTVLLVEISVKPADKAE